MRGYCAHTVGKQVFTTPSAPPLSIHAPTSAFQSVTLLLKVWEDGDMFTVKTRETEMNSCQVANRTVTGSA